jgi:hypothetical protein
MWHWHRDWQARAFELNGYALVHPVQPRANMGATGTRILAGSIVQVHVQASCTGLGTLSDTGVTLAGPVAVAARTRRRLLGRLRGRRSGLPSAQGSGTAHGRRSTP